VSAQVTIYLWNELSPYGDVVLETDESESKLASYVLGGAEMLSQTHGGATSYYLHDGQGSVRNLMDGSGAVTDTYAYTAFGELYAQTGTTANAYLHTGQQFDSLIGLYSLHARYYDPAMGRFLSRDTAKLALMAPEEIDRYVYTANNPIAAVDPGGLQAFVEYSEANQTSEEERVVIACKLGSKPLPLGRPF
jgi:RHS repeat-associated protein